MSREFEFTQLMRAYRKGVIGEATFEQEMARLEGAGTVDGGGFTAMGKTYGCERDAIVAYLQRVRNGEAAGAKALSKWAEVCKTDCMVSGLRTIAEREGYHVRVMDRKLMDLGVACETVKDPEIEKFVAMQSDPNIADLEKLRRIVSNFSNADDVVKPIHEFVELIKEDLDAKEMLALWAEDEFSSIKWFLHAFKALGGTLEAPASAAQPTMSAAQAH
ncbi:MAG: hypothetical protein ACLQU2_36385 [Candidatus Binataceae bacterium]